MTKPADESQKQIRLEMIRQAFQNKAPQMYKELKSLGQLQKFLEDHEEKMMACYNEEENKAWEKTLATFLDFEDPPSFDETSSPMG